MNVGSISIMREQILCDPLHHKFLLKDTSFTQQFSHIYTHRLQQSRELLRYPKSHRLTPNFFAYAVVNSWHFSAVAKLKWGQNIKMVQKLIDCNSDRSNETLALIGTLYKEMILKPSVKTCIKFTISFSFYPSWFIIMKTQVLDEFKEGHGLHTSMQSAMNITSSVCLRPSLFVGHRAHFYYL